MADTQISVVIPVYNSEECLSELVDRLTDVLAGTGRTYEIVLVNDCSPDGSWQKIVELSETHDRLRGVNLRRNFGQDSAIMAGLNHSSGQAVVIMDDDLQHDPGDIPALLAELDQGADVCYARFDVKKQTALKNLGSWFNGKVAEVIVWKPRHIYLSPYKALRREVVDEIVKYDGPYPYVDGLLFRVTRNIGQITVQHHTRYAGEGNYNLARSVRVWLRLATNFSVFPLRIATCLGFVASGLGFLLGVTFIVRHFTGTGAPTGWASMIVTVLFLGGIQLLALGVIGEYLGRLFLHNSKKPQFTVKEIRGLSED